MEKNISNHKLLFLFLLCSFFLNCKHTGSITQGKEIIDSNMEIKNNIETYIEANWLSYGYKTKPDKYIALTFDDGPCHPEYYGGSAALLKILNEYKVKATYFFVGEKIIENINEAHAIVAAGHEIGNHSDDHKDLGNAGRLSAPVVKQNLEAASQKIKDLTGVYPKVMRPPYLSNGTALTNACKDLGMAIIYGFIDPRDWDNNNTPQNIINSVLSKAHDGGIIIMHETYAARGRTIPAMPQIITGLRDKGYWFVTVSELAAIKGKTLEAGEVYNIF